MLKLTPPKLPASAAKKSSPPPVAQRAAQAKVQPLLPPRQRKTKNTSSAMDQNVSLSTREEDESRSTLLVDIGGKNDLLGSMDDVRCQKSKAKPLPKLPSPVPRTKVRGHRDRDNCPIPAPTRSGKVPPAPTQPLPVLKSRNGNGTREEERELSLRLEDERGKQKTSTPLRPVPVARGVSKENKETSSRNNGGTGQAKPPIPRKRVYKESLTESPIRERHPLPPSNPLPPVKQLTSLPASPHSGHTSARMSGSSPFKDQTRSKRKKGGGIRAPLWNAPPPPEFTPPPTPSHTPKK